MSFTYEELEHDPERQIWIELISDELTSINGVGRHVFIATFFDTRNLPDDILTKHFSYQTKELLYDDFAVSVNFPFNSFLLQDTFPSQNIIVGDSSNTAIWDLDYSENL